MTIRSIWHPFDQNELWLYRRRMLVNRVSSSSSSSLSKLTFLSRGSPFPFLLLPFFFLSLSLSFCFPFSSLSLFKASTSLSLLKPQRKPLSLFLDVSDKEVKPSYFFLVWSLTRMKEEEGSCGEEAHLERCFSRRRRERERKLNEKEILCHMICVPLEK